MIQNKSLQDAHTELLLYTLEHAKQDASFIHQLGVDAWAAQHADENSRPIVLAFALIGLYLHIEKGFTGRQVQDAHVLLARKRKDWPVFLPPVFRNTLTVFDVLNTTPGFARDAAIEKWCISVWKEWRESHEQVASLVQSELLHTKA